MFQEGTPPSMAPETLFGGWNLKKIHFTCVPSTHAELRSPRCDVFTYFYVVNIVHIWTYLDPKFLKTMERNGIKTA